MLQFLPLSDDYHKTYWSQRHADSADSNTVNSIKFEDIDELKENSYRMGPTDQQEFLNNIPMQVMLDVLPPNEEELQSDVLK